jgi:2-oxoglutarate dehydrogenase E2 component (dihydrolipoamide succinyltransferase)
MPVELRVPSVGESITEVQIGEWLKGPGDSVQQDEPVVVIETDKVTVELPAPASGVLQEILVGSGKTAAVGDVIGSLETDGAAAPAKRRGRAAPADEEGSARAPAEGAGARSKTKAGARAAEGAAPAKEARIMPAARRALAERGLEASEVEPSGPGGRLLKEDVERHAALAAPPERAQPPAAPEGPAPSPPAKERAPAAPPPRPAPAGAREEEAVPMTPMRKRIAARLVQSQQETATLTTFNEIDLSRVNALRAEHKQRFQERHGVKLGLMLFFVKAAIEALKRIPSVNAEIRGETLVYRNYYDIGIAVGGGKGLVVPVLRNAERLSFAEIELAIADFAERAKTGKLLLEELGGGTFTISNGGIYGSLMSTPILNPPQSGILGLHAIQDRPVAREGQVLIRPMMYVALSYDHRIIDGRESVTFLKTIKEAIEDPARMLLEI